MPRPSATIRTARLELAPLQVEDADEMVQVLADPALYAFTGGRGPARDELHAQYVAQVRGHSADGRESWHNWIVRERASRTAMGFVQATIVGGDPPNGPSAEIAWLIGVRWQGRGYASESAGGLVRWLDRAGVRQVLAHVHPEHAASAAVAGHVGLEPTDVIVDGERRWRRVMAGSPTRRR